MQPPAESNPPSSSGISYGWPFPTGPRRIALIGASVRAAAESAKVGGFSVTGVDRFGDQDTLDACDHHCLLDDETWVAGQPDRRVLAWLEQIAGEMPLVPVSGLNASFDWYRQVPLLAPWPDQREAAVKVRDLECLRQVTKGSPFQLPPSLTPSLGAWAKAPSGPIVAEQVTRWLRKDPHSSGGLGTKWLGEQEAISPDAISPDQVLQQWMPGRAYGATLLSNGREVILLGVCRSRFTRRGSLPFVYRGSLGPVAVTDSMASELQAIAGQLVSVSGLRGLFNLDFLAEPSQGHAEQPSRCWLLEVNPRWSASSELIERHLGRQRPDATVSMLSLAVQGLEGHPFPAWLGSVAIHKPSSRQDYKRILFARRGHAFDLASSTARLRAGQSLHDLPASGRWIQRREPVCTLITRIDVGAPCDQHGQIAGHQKGQSPVQRHRALIRSLEGIESDVISP